MIKIFRQARYNLMEKNKTGRYLKYAIGEIFLVFLGIIMALQFNNWNEERKNCNTAMYLLSSLQEDLKNDSEELRSNINDANNLVIMSKAIQLYHDESVAFSNDFQSYARSLVNGYQQVRMLGKKEKDALQLFTEHAATAVSCWRFWKYHIHTRITENADKHRQMMYLAKEIGDIPRTQFIDGVFG